MRKVKGPTPGRSPRKKVLVTQCHEGAKIQIAPMSATVECASCTTMTCPTPFSKLDGTS